MAGDLVLLGGPGGGQAGEGQMAEGGEAMDADGAGAEAAEATPAAEVAPAAEAAKAAEAAAAAEGGAEGAADEGGGHSGSAGRLAAVHVVTEAEAARGTYSIHDVVLPLPGSRVQYPRHETGDVIREVGGAQRDRPMHACRARARMEAG